MFGIGSEKRLTTHSVLPSLVRNETGTELMGVFENDFHFLHGSGHRYSIVIRAEIVERKGWTKLLLLDVPYPSFYHSYVVIWLVMDPTYPQIQNRKLDVIPSLILPGSPAS